MLVLVVLFSCDVAEKRADEPQTVESNQQVKSGTLFIIGGGPRPEALMRELALCLQKPELASVAILTMASSEPDSAFYYQRIDLESVGFRNIWQFDVRVDSTLKKLDELSETDLIFISGGDQNRFMQLSDTLSIVQRIKDVHSGGGVIAGTSAGAAMMSAVMISGDQKLAGDYESTYSRLKVNNAVYQNGLGLLKQTIVDQHFVERSRYNRLITALYDYPKKMGVGIGESTAIIVIGAEAQVVGAGQVVRMERTESASKSQNDLIQIENINLGVYAHGDRFKIYR